MLYKRVYGLLFISFFVISCSLSTSHKDYDDDDDGIKTSVSSKSEHSTFVLLI